MQRPFRREGNRARAGFTIIEILTIVAILGILAALLFPVVGRAQQNAREAKTRVQFSQWGTAIEAYRQEYGFYPPFAALIADNHINTPEETEIFVRALSGRNPNGTAMTETEAEQLNKKRIGFYSFGANDLTEGASPLLRDAFDNREIVVLLDRNYDGLITTTALPDGDGYGTLPAVGGKGPPALPQGGVRAAVAFYSAGAANSPEDIVTSW